MESLKKLFLFASGPLIYLMDRLKPMVRRSMATERTPDDQKILFARHEIGHAFIAWQIADVQRIWLVYVHERGGDVIAIGPPPKNNASRWSDILLLLGGIAGEAVLTGELWPHGARFDLAGARATCASLLLRTSSTVSPWQAERRCDVDMTQLFSEPLSDEERAILNQCYDKAHELMRRRRDDLERAAQELARIGSLSHGDLVRLFGERPRSKRAKHERFGLIETENI